MSKVRKPTVTTFIDMIYFVNRNLSKIRIVHDNHIQRKQKISNSNKKYAFLTSSIYLKN